jgi:Protein of unknown function DUF72
VKDGGTIESREPFEVSDPMQKASDTADAVAQKVDELGSQLVTTVDEVQVAVSQGRRVVQSIGQDVKATAAATQRITEDVAGIVADVRASEGTVDKILEDDSGTRARSAARASSPPASRSSPATAERLWVVSESADWPLTEELIAGFVYVRLHGSRRTYESSYRDGELDRWASRIRSWNEGDSPGDARRITERRPPRRKSRDVYLFFDNDRGAHAPEDALRLSQRLR